MRGPATWRRRPPSWQPGRAARQGQQGFSLLAVTMLAVLLGVVAFVVYYRWEVEQLAADRLAQDVLLDKADAVTKGFAAIKGRLPCPAATYGGNERCDGTLAKGWFPADVASLFAPDDVAQRLKGLRYFADARLSNVKDVFPKDPHNNGIVNGHDFCRELLIVDPGVGGVDGGLPGSAGVRTPLVYGFAAPGPAGFTGLNAGSSATLEDQDREQTLIYRERVRAGNARSLAMASNCGAVIGSLNMLTIAAQWNSAMPDARSGAAYWYSLYTIWPMVNALATSQMMAVGEGVSFVTEVAALGVGIAVSEGKDDAACFALYFPACVAAGVQVAQAIIVAAQGVALALDVLALETRVIAAAIQLAQARNFKASYEAVDIWDGQNAFLFDVDARGPLIWEDGP